MERVTDEITTKYELSEEDTQLLDRWRHYKPHGDQSRRFIKINQSTRKLAAIILENCPRSRELSLALTHLENVRLWSNNAIMKNEVGPDG